MYKFPEHYYVDVRIEQTESVRISYEGFEMIEQNERSDCGAFVRLFDGQRWYYASCTDLEQVQEYIDALGQMATPSPDILKNPIVERFEVHREKREIPIETAIRSKPLEVKKAFLESLFDAVADPVIVQTDSYYVEEWKRVQFFSSKGSALDYDKETCGIRFNLSMVSGENRERMSVSKGTSNLEALLAERAYFESEIEKSIDFVKNATSITPGVYTVLLSPMATGIFTHESFGHKSEADFMIGDEAMKAAWPMGKPVASSLVSIVDSGEILGSGYVPFDDEGTRGRKNKIIENGMLTGRLHSAVTASELNEGLTGNARALNFEYEPIVRMTSTYIEAGDRPLAEIVAEIENGVYIDSVKHGSGMSTFTMAPMRAYRIENGKNTEPVRISVVTGNVFETLNEVDALSSEFEILSFVGGGCGKMEQWPLPVAFGGPYTRVKKLNVQ